MSRFLAIRIPAECLRQAATGDRDAQRQVYEASAGPVFALISRMLRSRAAAEDVFQDSMVGLLRNLGQYRGDAPFGAWVRRIALHQCLMHVRSPWQRARQGLEILAGIEEPLSPRSVDPQTAERIDLERALATLPAMARAIVLMHDVEGMSHEEIAAEFGRSVSFSKSRLSRAHARLRELLADHHSREPAAAEPQVVVPRVLP